MSYEVDTERAAGLAGCLEFCSLRSEICLVENINTENKRGRGIVNSAPRRTRVAETVEEQRSAE